MTFIFTVQIRDRQINTVTEFVQVRILIKLFIHSEANGTINLLHHNKYPKISTQLYYFMFLNSLTFIANPEGIMFLGHSKSVE